jgi:hypothetical protein
MVLLSGQKIANGFLVTYYLCAGDGMMKYARSHFKKTSSSWHPETSIFASYQKNTKCININIFSAIN